MPGSIKFIRSSSSSSSRKAINPTFHRASPEFAGGMRVNFGVGVSACVAARIAHSDSSKSRLAITFMGQSCETSLIRQFSTGLIY